MIPRDRLTGWLWRKGRGVDPWIRHAPAAAAKCQDAPCAKMSLRNKAVYGADGSIPGSHQGRDARSGTVLLCAGCTAWRTSSQFIHIEPDETDTLARVPARLPGRTTRRSLIGRTVLTQYRAVQIAGSRTRRERRRPWQAR